MNMKSHISFSSILCLFVKTEKWIIFPKIVHQEMFFIVFTSILEAQFGISR
jgi:hypothetical protein